MDLESKLAINNVVLKKDNSNSASPQLQFITNTLNISKKLTVSIQANQQNLESSRKESSDSTSSYRSNTARMRITAPCNSPDLYRSHKTTYEGLIGSLRVHDYSKLGRNTYTVSEFNEFKNKLLRNHPKMGTSTKDAEKTVIYDFNTYKNMKANTTSNENRFVAPYVLPKKAIPILKSHQIKSMYDTLNSQNHKNDDLANHLISNFSQLRQVSFTDLKRFNQMHRRAQNTNPLTPTLLIKKLN